MSTVRISEYTGNISGRSGSFDYISVTGGITASNLFLDDNTLYLGSTPFSKSDIDNLKSGIPISTDTEKALVSAKDSTTFIRTSGTGRMAHYVGNRVILDLKSDSVTIGGLSGSSFSTSSRLLHPASINTFSALGYSCLATAPRV